MTNESYAIRAKLARRLPDPNFGKSEGIEHHLMLVNCRDLPADLPLEANARRPNTRKMVYREVRDSLLDQTGEPGTFHLKNKGIVIVADRVEPRRGTNDEFMIHLDRTRQGILDGGHTYQLIMECREDDELPEDQHVFVQIRTSVPKEWIPAISEGLNTSVQVQEMSLQNLAGKFAWLKSDLKGHFYSTNIAWSENDPGDVSARDVIALLYMLNIGLFPDATNHPTAGYEKKSDALKAFDKTEPSFKAMKPVIDQILQLHDWITFTASDFYNQGASDVGKKGRGAGLSFMKRAKRKPFRPIFWNAGRDFDTQLEDAALYPVLAAFRVFLTHDQLTGQVKWAVPFEAVKKAWRDLAYDLLKATQHTANEFGPSKNAIGKSRLHWDGIYQKVENYMLRSTLKQAS